MVNSIEMDDSNNKFQKYNVTLSKIIGIIVNLKQEQQWKLLQYSEELIAEDNRASKRKSCQIPVNCAVSDRIFSGYINNISASGLFMATRIPFEVGKGIHLSFSMQGYDRPFKIKGEIVRSNQSGVGIEYKEINPYLAEMLDTLVKRMKC